MKKTLIALATLAAVSGTAFAQSTVSLTGGIAYGYRTSTTNNVTSKGFGMDTAAIKLTVTEDLGGGLKATGVISAGGLARGNAVTGEDMSLTVAGGFGTVTMGQIEIGSGIRGLASAGAPVNNMETEVLAAAVNSDIVKYTAPKMGDFTLSASLTEGSATSPAVAGLGAGLTDAGVASSRAVTVGAAYAAGPLAAAVDTSSWSNSAAADSRYRIAASYNLGVATVGAGFDSTKAPVTGNRTKYTMVGVSAPLGAVTVGAVYAKKDTVATGTLTGSSFGASYALSKRTSLSANYSKWDNAEGSTVSDKKTNIVLAHAF